MQNNNDLSVLGIFKIKKLGASGWTSKDRMLILTEKGVSYYALSSQINQNFLLMFKNAYASETNVKDDETFKRLCDQLKIISEDELGTLKGFISYNLISNDDKSPSKNNSYKFPLTIKQMTSKSKKNINNNDNKKNEWNIDFLYQNSYERYMKVYSDIKKFKDNISKEITINKTDPIKSQINNKQSIIEKKKDDEIKPQPEQPKKREEVADVDPDAVNQIYYNEMCYQYLFKQYYTMNSTRSGNQNYFKQKYEFAILQVYTKFRELCQTLVKKVIFDLGARPFSNTNNYSFFPMVLPIHKSLKKSEQAVFLYYIVGINIQLSWVYKHLN